MKVLSSTKNITQTQHGNGVILRVDCENESWLASFEESDEGNILLDNPIKVLHLFGDKKQAWKSYKEFNLTDEIVRMLDKVIQMWDQAPDETKKVLL